MPITAAQLQHYIEHGFVIVPDFLSREEVAAGLDGFGRYFPSAEELDDTPERYGFIHDDPERLQVEFPYADENLNHFATHPRLISFVENVLGADDIRLTQNAIWAKYAGLGNYEQALHLDYQGNTLVVPRDDGTYRQVNMIFYFTDVTGDLGPTVVVSQAETKDMPLWPTHRPRKMSPALYEKERHVVVPAGGLLIFSMRTWHRASNMTAERGERFSQHFVWRAAAHDFQGYHLYSRLGENEDLQEFISHTTPRQREVLGFPPPADPFWNAETRAAVALRYPEMDMTPYEEK